MESSEGLLDRGRVVVLVLVLGFAFGGALAYFRVSKASGLVSPVNSSSLGDESSFSPFAFWRGQAPKPLASLVSDLGKVLGLETTNDDSSAPSTPVQAPKTTGVSQANPSSSTTTSQTSSELVSGSTSTSNSSSTSSSSSPSSSSSAYSPAQQAVEDASLLVIVYLKASNFNALYNLMSADFKETFAKEDFVASFAGAVGVASGQAVSAPKVYGTSNEWSEQSISLTLVDGSSQKYLNIYHLEDSAWTLFGTEEQ